MRLLVTGSTGFIGSELVRELSARGYNVVCLYRDPGKIRSLQYKGVEFARGDILDRNSLLRACNGCEGVFHLAAFAGIWARNKEIIRQLNVEGTINILEAALETGVKNIVITSTAGVIGPSAGKPVDEETERLTGFFTTYEVTKAEAEKVALGYIPKGLNIRIVNPTRLYGPGSLNAGNSVTKIIRMYLNRKWKYIVGDGNSTGNYAYIDDVVDGHILAMEKGKQGERYLLGGENISYNDFFRLLGEISGIRSKLYHIPVPAALFVAKLSVLLAQISGKGPFITPDLVRRYNHDWEISSAKAEKMLGYKITPLREGMWKTVEWLNSLHDRIPEGQKHQINLNPDF
ncbi:MAG: SDR family oxidoreductase [Bacteroidales bacterium]